MVTAIPFLAYKKVNFRNTADTATKSIIFEVRFSRAHYRRAKNSRYKIPLFSYKNLFRAVHIVINCQNMLCAH